MGNQLIQVDIISGFLGAGKTTLIQNIIGVGAHSGGLMILENEFGAIDVDGEVLEAAGVEVESIIAGCICCSGADVFINKLSEIASSYAPRQLIIEPTGIARLSDIRRIFQCKAVGRLYQLNRVVTVVDAVTYPIWIKVSKDFFNDQIRFSDLIYVSKVEDCMSQQVIELLSLIDTIHPGCPVSTDIHELLAYWNTGIKKKACSSMYLAPGKASGLFETFSIGYSEGFNHSSLLQLLDKVQEGVCGSVYRIKGCFQDETETGYTLDWVGNRYRLIPSGSVSNPSTRLCFIGSGLDRESLNDALEQIKIN